MIYLDHASTTPCSPEVIEEMLPYFRESFANASSTDHLLGNAAFRAVESSRESIAQLMGVRTEDVVFTSGSTEANNLLLTSSTRVITTPIEHASIIDPLNARFNPSDKKIQVDSNGRVSLDSLREELSAGQRALVTVIGTNNETGSEQDCASIAAVVKEYDGLLHIDATQMIGLRQLDLQKLSIDGASISAHKIYGPKGIGALVARKTLRKELQSILRGGGHERGLRSGTLNVPGIVGFGAAARRVIAKRTENRIQIEKIRFLFLDELGQSLASHITETVDSEFASPHILSLRIQGVNSRALLSHVNADLAFSLGSACATLKTEPSHVLIALGLDKNHISETFRISFSVETSAAQAKTAAIRLSEAANALLEFSEAG